MPDPELRSIVAGVRVAEGQEGHPQELPHLLSDQNRQLDAHQTLQRTGGARTGQLAV